MGTENKESKKTYSVPNLERSFRILECLSDSRHGMNLTELVKATGYPNNSVFRICHTLEELGYINRDEVNRTYRISMRILNLALGSVSPGKNIFEIVKPYLEKIAFETGETTCMGTISENHGVVLQVAHGTHPFRFHIDLGASFELHTAAPGKAMLAAMSSVQREAVVKQMNLSKKTTNTITKKMDFLKHLDEVRRVGYGVDDEEDIIGQRCVGVSLKTGSSPGCSIWITAPISRLSDVELKKAAEFIRSVCHDIEQELNLQ